MADVPAILDGGGDGRDGRCFHSEILKTSDVTSAQSFAGSTCYCPVKCKSGLKGAVRRRRRGEEKAGPTMNLANFVLRIRNARTSTGECVFFGRAYVLKMHRLQNAATYPC